MSKWKAALHKSCIAYLKGVSGILENTLITAVKTQKRFHNKYLATRSKGISQRGKRHFKSADNSETHKRSYNKKRKVNLLQHRRPGHATKHSFCVPARI